MSVHISSACKKLEYRGAKREVLLEFADHANDDGICWPSRGRIMYNTGLSESAVKQQMKELRDAGVLVVVDQHEGGRGKVPIYKVCPEKGPQKAPFSEWCMEHGKGPKGPSDDRKRGHDVTPEPSVEPSVNTSKDVEGLPSPGTFVAYLREELDGSDVPLLRNREERYAGEFNKLIAKGMGEDVLYKAADRIVERWTGDDHRKLTVEQALEDVVNGKAPAHVNEASRYRGTLPPPWEPINPHGEREPRKMSAENQRMAEENAALERELLQGIA